MSRHSPGNLSNASRIVWCGQPVESGSGVRQAFRDELRSATSLGPELVGDYKILVRLHASLLEETKHQTPPSMSSERLDALAVHQVPHDQSISRVTRQHRVHWNSVHRWCQHVQAVHRAVAREIFNGPITRSTRWSCRIKRENDGRRRSIRATFAMP
jgi:hypothetical protein